MKVAGSTWLGTAVAAGLAAVAGVLVTLALGGGKSTEVHTLTVTVPFTNPLEPNLIATTNIPNVIGYQLRDAEVRIRQAGFSPYIVGAGRRTAINKDNWQVVAQTPAPGLLRPSASAVRLRIRRHLTEEQ